MKIAITGHTSGIGKALYDYFSTDNTVVGFSRSTGYNIDNESDRNRILSEIGDCDIFINSAYCNFNDSQLLMLQGVCSMWVDLNKMVINISSRNTVGTNLYCVTKRNLDVYCESMQYRTLYLLNIKPGLVDTPRVEKIKGNRMDTADILSAVEFCLLNKDRFRVHTMCFGK